MFTVKAERIKDYENPNGSEFESLTVEELLELVIDLIDGKVATTLIGRNRYFLSLDDLATDEGEDEDEKLFVKGTIKMMLEHLSLDEEERKECPNCGADIRGDKENE